MSTSEGGRQGFTRRSFVKAAAAALGTSGLSGAVRADDDACDGSNDIALVNGRILTMDAANTVASAVTIRNGRITSVGHPREVGHCARTINLKGATVIPGLIDSHLHFIRDGLNPGHEVRIIETATSIKELQQMITARAASVPPGQFITCVGGWNRNAFAENRIPTLAELDAAAPNHPLYLTETGGVPGPAKLLTNSAGIKWFTLKGVAVNGDGTVVNGASAFGALRNAEIAGDPALPDRMTTTKEAVDFVASLGLTCVHDVGGNGGPLGVNGTLFKDLKPYDQALALWRVGKLNVRVRTFFYSEIDTGFSIAKARMDQGLVRIGDDVFRVNGVGERVNISTTDPGFIDHCIYAAQNGWTVHQHSSTQAEISLHIQALQAADAAISAKGGIGPLRWSLTHLNTITDAQIQALVAMRTGATVQGTSHTSASGGTPFRRIYDQMTAAGLPVGGGSDATNVGPLNPWLMMSFMSTGINNAGASINAAQSLTRLEALRTYTIGSAYFGFDDDRLGSIERGKLADLVVLSDDPLTVSNDRFRKLRSTLTLQGGRIVHGGDDDRHHGHGRGRGDRD